ncbi:unnamed protein product [marine sediment metagenome]|uniref:Uncharacterized protein n=1 Tax=marine sediment metagenome TaxID=412755 RepID=X0ZF34_9ZZZZ
MITRESLFNATSGDDSNIHLSILLRILILLSPRIESAFPSLLNIAITNGDIIPRENPLISAKIIIVIKDSVKKVL